MSDTSDVIEVRGLQVAGICGVLPEERERPQPLEVDLDLVVDLAAAGRSDDLADTIDYGAITTRVHEVVSTTSFQLLERLAEEVATACLGDVRVGEVRVSVRKLRPPVPELVRTTGVRITRRR
jgi:dihydroneopterin aldolase